MRPFEGDRTQESQRGRRRCEVGGLPGRRLRADSKPEGRDSSVRVALRRGRRADARSAKVRERFSDTAAVMPESYLSLAPWHSSTTVVRPFSCAEIQGFRALAQGESHSFGAKSLNVKDPPWKT